MGPIIGAVAGFVLAVVAGFGLVSAASGGSEAPVSQNYVIYGNN